MHRINMSRGILKATDNLFDIIKMNFDLSSSLPKDFYNNRWIKGDALEKKWLSQCKIISHVEISIETRFVFVEFDSEFFFIVVGLESPDYIPSGVIVENLNAGIFTAIVSELELPVRKEISNLFLQQYILSQNDTDSLYQGHDLADLVKVFPNLFVMKITPSYGGDRTNIQQFICFYLTLNTKFVLLPFKKKTLDKIYELVAGNSKILSYESITQALFSSHFKFAFLDLYRCIELLYQLIHLDETYHKLSLTINRTDFLIAIENNLGWRPTERTSLIKICNETPDVYKIDLSKAVREINPQLQDYGNWIYDLRCNVVHLKSIQKKFDLKADNWEKLIYGVASLLCHWYNKYPNFD